MTTGITYMRTGQYYLNQGGSYSQFLPKVLAACEGRPYIDYAFHVAPMMKEHIDELPLIAKEFGITSFKSFMFYGGFGLHGASSSQREFLMIPDDESYDIAHFEFVMRACTEMVQSEGALGHLLADFHTAANLGGEVNPPLSSPEDVETLWERMLADGTIVGEANGAYVARGPRS